MVWKIGKYLLLLIVAVVTALLIYIYYPEKKLEKNAVIDKILVLKSKRELRVYSKGKLLKTYAISLGLQPVGAKEIEGDMKTPEGGYIINDKNPHSDYHKNLGISYPNNNDIKRAKMLGKSTGGSIKIHGFRNGYDSPGKFHRWMDWTHGCIALTDEEVDELYAHTKIGTPIIIKP